MRLCADLCEFDEVVLATHSAPPARQTAFLRIAPIPRIEDLRWYSWVILDGLKKLVRTEYVLIVQDDGFIINPGAWNSTFYDYDYIGAPWPPTLNAPGGTVLQMNNRVGNGGFSLRSRRLMEECSLESLYQPEYGMIDEDMLICHFNHARLVDKGIRFADLSLASRFSGETPSMEGELFLADVFGFHGHQVLDALGAEAHRLTKRG
jgi:hypothetical protein